MIYDCFIFNDELDLLEIRLNFLADAADRFVIVESARTLAGSPKPLHYLLNKERFGKFHDKIIHVIAPVNDLPAWDYEFYQRNYIKTALVNCAEDDIIFISDVDEIININNILSFPWLKLPVLVELPASYYFLNVRTNASFFVNIVATWAFLKDKDIGFRYRDYPTLTNNRITTKMVHTGWHFSYLFGFDISKYQEKIRSSSHQEYNKPYFLNKDRIYRCVLLCIDLFERPFIKLSVDNAGIEPILTFIPKENLAGLLYKPSAKYYLSPKNLLFILHKKYYRRIKNSFQQLFSRKNKGTV